jgi:hypothetical protein
MSVLVMVVDALVLMDMKHGLSSVQPAAFRLLLLLLLVCTLSVKHGDQGGDATAFFALALTHFLSPSQPSFHVSVEGLF